MGTPKVRNGTPKFLSIRQRLNPFLASHLCTIWIEFDKMADAAQRAIQWTIIVWLLKKRRAKRARMIEEKHSSFLYIYNRQRRYYFGQLLLACINQAHLRTIWMNSQTRFFHGFFLTQNFYDKLIINLHFLFPVRSISHGIVIGIALTRNQSPLDVKTLSSLLKEICKNHLAFEV